MDVEFCAGLSTPQAGVTVITNDSDFEVIRYYHRKLKLMNAEMFFG